MLFFGTGDSEHPKDATIQNGFYVVKDKNAPGTLTKGIWSTSPTMNSRTSTDGEE